MVAESSSRGSRLFPEIRIDLRTGSRSSQILLTPVVQIATVSAVIVIAGALFCFGGSWLRYTRAVGIQEAAVIRAETANADLQHEVASLRDMLALAMHAREQAEAQLSALASQQRGEVHPPPAASEETAAGKIAQLTQALDQSQRELEQKHSEREILRPEKLAGAFRLASFITEELAPSETDTSRPEVLITDAPPEAEQDSGGVAELGHRALSEFARVLASTGLNVARLFPQLGVDRAEGGPFVPPPKAGQPDGISLDKLEAMRSLMKSLPLSTPLDQYQLESRFGPRRDPFNHRPSFHTGIDLSAPYMSPVYATAAGVVTYAGYRADYGKVVEISHGNGIATVYGHLHRYIVAVGQTVAEHTQIGFLGSTGRSSGPHVHYEILVNDEPQDPEKFLGLARVIPASDK